MNKMKKLLAILVAFVMCFTVFGMVASADEFNPTVYLKTNFDDNEATTVTANISTSQACGAIQGTLKFTGASYVENSAKFIEDGATADKLVINGNEIKFVVVTDELAKGDTNWASFKFQITKADADVTFDEEKAALINLADKVIIIAQQTLSSVLATNILVSNINGANLDKYVFICDDFDKDEDNALISPSVSLKFSISDYIDHFANYENMKPDDLSKENSIQRTAFLII